MKKYLIAATAALALCAGTAKSNADTFIMGAGYGKCSLYLTARSQNGQMADILFSSWAQGFMSAANIAAKLNGKPTRDIGALSVDAETTQLRSYCLRHPNDQYLDGVLDLMNALPTNAEEE